MREYVQVVTTTASKTDAEKIADTLVERRLAGCVQIFGPITSTYRWQGKIERAEEWLCLIKTYRDLYQDIESTICCIHPYRVPEILVIPVIEGSKGYLSWLDSELKKAVE